MSAYHLTGTRETASGINLHEDNTFEFYFAYGAVDRHGYGTWKKINDVIILQSDYAEKQGFTLLSESHQQQGHFLVQLDKPDVYFANMLHGFAISDMVSEESVADAQGNMRFETPTPEKIMLVHEFFPDNVVTIPVTAGMDTMRIIPNHDLLLVHFDQVKCIDTDAGLIMPLPMLTQYFGDRTFVYEMQAS